MAVLALAACGGGSSLSPAVSPDVWAEEVNAICDDATVEWNAMINAELDAWLEELDSDGDRLASDVSGETDAFAATLAFYDERVERVEAIAPPSEITAASGELVDAMREELAVLEAGMARFQEVFSGEDVVLDDETLAELDDSDAVAANARVAELSARLNVPACSNLQREILEDDEGPTGP